MNRSKLIIILLAVLLAVCLPLTSYAQPPRRVSLLGAIYGGDGSTAYRSLSIVPINNNVFGVYSTTDLELCTRMMLTFRTDVDIQSFAITLRLLTTNVQFNWTAITRDYTQLYTISEQGTQTNGLSVANQTTVSKDQTNNSVTWIYSGNATGRNGFNVSLVFQNFMLGTTPVYFECVALSVNGTSVEEIEINQYAEQFQQKMDYIEDIEERAYQQIDIHINDIRDYLNRTDGDHYFGCFHYLFNQSVLLSTMVVVVCLFGIIGFIIYGKKV